MPDSTFRVDPISNFAFGEFKKAKPGDTLVIETAKPRQVLEFVFKHRQPDMGGNKYVAFGRLKEYRGLKDLAARIWIRGDGEAFLGVNREHLAHLKALHPCAA
ncbi:MAG: hypothetical protein WC767_02660 [Candidatus Paceibacterota bacterium]|jgi:hypothetical protein